MPFPPPIPPSEANEVAPWALCDLLLQRLRHHRHHPAADRLGLGLGPRPIEPSPQPSEKGPRSGGAPRVPPYVLRSLQLGAPRFSERKSQIPVTAFPRGVRILECALWLSLERVGGLEKRFWLVKRSAWISKPGSVGYALAMILPLGAQLPSLNLLLLPASENPFGLECHQEPDIV